jgi:excinuclease ABC subunit B
MQTALGEMERRRGLQEAYNEEHGITPASIVKGIDDVLSSVYERDYVTVPLAKEETEEFGSRDALRERIASLEQEMRDAAANLEFERATALRDRVKRLREHHLGVGGPP